MTDLAIKTEFSGIPFKNFGFLFEPKSKIIFEKAIIIVSQFLTLNLGELGFSMSTKSTHMKGLQCRPTWKANKYSRQNESSYCYSTINCQKYCKSRWTWKYLVKNLNISIIHLKNVNFVILFSLSINQSSFLNTLSTYECRHNANLLVYNLPSKKPSVIPWGTVFPSHWRSMNVF